MNSFIPPGDPEGALHQARLDVESWYRVRGEKKDMRWAEWAGDKLGEMMRDREATIRALRSPHIHLRLAAASLAAEYWPSHERFAPEVLRLAFQDSESSVRGAALYAIWLVKHHVSDPTGFLRQLFAELFPLPPEDVRAEILRGVRERKRRTVAVVGGRWEGMAGIHAAAMGESRAAAESYLSHPDPKLRRAALLAIKYHWTPDEAFKGHCERLVSEDHDVEVRSLALTCLAGCYSQSDDARIGRLAAQLVVDESAPRDLRLSAYSALFTIRGMPTEAVLAAHRSRSRFPENIDWEFVDTFLHERG